jgi:hypothetical protein
VGQRQALTSVPLFSQTGHETFSLELRRFSGWGRAAAVCSRGPRYDVARRVSRIRRKICAASSRPPIGRPFLTAKMPTARAGPVTQRTFPSRGRRPQPALLYLPITRCALLHSLRDKMNVLGGLYCFTVQLASLRRTSRLISAE